MAEDYVNPEELTNPPQQLCDLIREINKKYPNKDEQYTLYGIGNLPLLTDLLASTENLYEKVEFTNLGVCSPPIGSPQQEKKKTRYETP
ncbi:hypothetical protein HY643_02565 [Candidatus Woesearchaeota archaeon]|nr:hypothetical protein [Candidatus Woesearchaeota archaeon]